MRRHLLVTRTAPRALGRRRPRAPHRASSRRSTSARSRAPASPAFGSFWQTNYGTATLSRVNPRTNKVTRPAGSARSRAGSPPAPAASGSTATAPSTVERVNRAHAQGREADPRRRQRLGRRVRVRLGLGDEQLRRLGLADRPGHEPDRQDDQDRRPADATSASATDAIWVGSNRPDGQDVYRIDPATNTSTAVADRAHPPERDHRHAPTPSGSRTATTRSRGSTRRRRPSSRRSRSADSRSRAPRRPTGRSGSRIRPTNTISVIDPATNAVVAHGEDRRRRRSSCARGFGDMWVGSFRAPTSGASGRNADPPQPPERRGAALCAAPRVVR